MQVETVLHEDPQLPYAVEISPGSVLAPQGIEDDWVASFGDIDVMKDGRVLIAEMFSDRFLIVSPGGKEARWVGRGGAGPGEYGFVRLVRSDGDRIHVFDQTNARRTVLDEDLNVVHSNPMFVQLQFDGVILGDSAYVVNGTLNTPDQIGYVLHLFDAEGGAMRSFDELPGAYGVPGGPIAPKDRWLATDRAGRVWSARRQEYRIDLWNPWTGIRELSLVRMADWFPARLDAAEAEPWGPDTPGQPWVSDIAADADGRLWLAVSVASPEWAECFGESPESGAAEYIEGCVLFDTLVEVIDPVAGRVLASTRLPHHFWSIWEGLGLSGGYDEFGFPTFQLWNLQLNETNHEGGEQC